MTSIPRVVFTLSQIAAALGVRRSKVRDYVDDGRIATVQIDGRERVALVELERIQREGIPGKEATPRGRRRGAKRAVPTNAGDEIRKLPI